jgi:long-chain fatty acid transport protein
MNSFNLKLLLLLFSLSAYSQTGHILQGVGAVNMSMGGASTGQPLDISGALQWNPASITVFDDQILKLDIGLFFSSPELYSTVPEFDSNGQPTGNFFSGNTKDDRGTSIIPSLAMVWGKENSKHTFGVSAIGISGFGVTFPESMTNPITMPQNKGGFGRIESDYMLLQVGFTWAYELTEKISIGIQPTFDYAGLELNPNPLSSPNPSLGYPKSDLASALGFGAQFGLFYNSGSGFKAGTSYKTNQRFSKFKFDSHYLDGSVAPDVDFRMDYPAILSFGLGYSKGDFDLALDYRTVYYENTEGFEKVGWTETASVKGFGWENISVVSAGIQFKGIEKLPLRFGYTYSSNPINEDVVFFNVPATAIIKNAFQFGLSFNPSSNLRLDALYHHGTSSGKTKGQLLNPMFIQDYPPYGAIPGSEVSYDMTTDMITLGLSYTFKKANKETKSSDL